ncbi:CGNR zinc finger domain-containing protein [Arthrobacter rhombi]|uniref:CGNR zinc finger domain-containing protein n=1 Tax=Arthrobacter rhombi TaxID=71253 RepID=UPI003FD4BBBF
MANTEFEHYKGWAVDLAIDLVNTATTDDDRLAHAGDVAELLTRHHVAARRPATDDDAAHLRAVRGQLRAVMDADDITQAAPSLNSLAAEGGCTPRLSNHDGHDWHLDHHIPGDLLWRHVAAECAAGLMDFVLRHSPRRLRSCAASDCSRYFADRTRNASARFCPQRGCANRTRVRRHRRAREL